MAAEHGHQLTDGHDEHAEHERPEDWGWHHEFSTGRQIMGWFTVIVLVLLFTTTHYNLEGALGILLVLIPLVGGLLWDRHRRKTQWRS